MDEQIPQQEPVPLQQPAPRKNTKLYLALAIVIVILLIEAMVVLYVQKTKPTLTDPLPVDSGRGAQAVEELRYLNQYSGEHPLSESDRKSGMTALQKMQLKQATVSTTTRTLMVKDINSM
jgi:hypothetical protein